MLKVALRNAYAEALEVRYLTRNALVTQKRKPNFLSKIGSRPYKFFKKEQKARFENDWLSSESSSQPPTKALVNISETLGLRRHFYLLDAICWVTGIAGVRRMALLL